MEKKHLDEIKKLLDSDKLIIGQERTIKALKSGTVAKVFVAKNASDELKADVDQYGEKAEVVHTDKTNEELGTICKKPFAISVLGVAK